MREWICSVMEPLNREWKFIAKQELVRCKNCRFYNSQPDSHGDRCDKIHWSRSEDWFCADGVKRE